MQRRRREALFGDGKRLSDFLAAFQRGHVGARSDRAFGLVALVAAALSLAVVDLRRRKLGAPGRLVAWLTLGLAVLVGALLLRAMLAVRR